MMSLIVNMCAEPGRRTSPLASRAAVAYHPSVQRSYPNTTLLEQKLHENLGAVRRRIAEACERAQRDPDDVRLVAVTKSVGVDVIQTLLRMGTIDLGENRAQQLSEREFAIREYLARPDPHPARQPAPAPRWHMIGNLQRKKVKALLPAVTMIHSVDRLRLAEEINKRAQEQSRRIDILLEINAGDEPQKGGAAVCAAAHLGEQIASLPHLRLCGLMSMAPLTNDRQRLRNVFSRVYELYEEMRHEYDVGDAFDTLSMGMTADFELAVECGSNLLRLGTVLYEGIESIAHDASRSPS